MAQAGVTVDGVDLFDYGLILDRSAAGWRDGTSRTFSTQQLPERAGTIWLDDSPQEVERRLTLNGFMVGDSRSDLMDKNDNLKAFLYGGRLQVTLDDQPNRLYKMYCEDYIVEHIGAALSKTNRRQFVDITLVAFDPLQYSTSLTTIDFTSSQSSVPQGTGAVAPLIEIEGSVSSPTIVYRDGAGTEVERLELTGSLGAGEVLEIDCSKKTIQLSDGTNKIDMLSGGDFIVLSGQDKDGSTEPTIELSSGTPTRAEAEYRKAYI